MLMFISGGGRGSYCITYLFILHSGVKKTTAFFSSWIVVVYVKDIMVWKWSVCVCVFLLIRVWLSESPSCDSVFEHVGVLRDPSVSPQNVGKAEQEGDNV